MNDNNQLQFPFGPLVCPKCGAESEKGEAMWFDMVEPICLACFKRWVKENCGVMVVK